MLARRRKHGECAHKLAKIDIHAGREEELINMFIECCSHLLAL
jgi:hypothetical protein